MSTQTEEPQSATATLTAPPPEQREKLTRKGLSADHPTWCPGCGDFSVLAMYQRLLEVRNLQQENIVTLSGIGCSSRFPYFVNTHSVHFIHGRILPFSMGVTLSRPDLHVFVFSGDGDTFSIGGNHLDHCARKNLHMSLVVMNNEVYGLTKKQTSPTSPAGFKSKTDPWGAQSAAVNPVKKLISNGTTFVARTHASNPKHMLSMMEKAMDHKGFSVIECLSECVEFFPGAFDSSIPRKGGEFREVPPEHDVTDEIAAYKLAQAEAPGYFGVIYQVERPTLNETEARIVTAARERGKGKSDRELLQASLEKLT